MPDENMNIENQDNAEGKIGFTFFENIAEDKNSNSHLIICGHPIYDNGDCPKQKNIQCSDCLYGINTNEI